MLEKRTLKQEILEILELQDMYTNMNYTGNEADDIANRAIFAVREWLQQKQGLETFNRDYSEVEDELLSKNELLEELKQ